jgi:hypothetical protein
MRLQRSDAAAQRAVAAGAQSVASQRQIAAETAWPTQHRSYRKLLEVKRGAYWRYGIDADRPTPTGLCRSVHTLLGQVASSPVPP